MTDTGFIYCITNKITGLQYIGQTRVSVSERYKQHIDEAFKTNRNSHLYNSISYIKDSNITNAKLKSIKYRITYTCENKQSHAYNFGWKYIDKV